MLKLDTHNYKDYGGEVIERDIRILCRVFKNKKINDPECEKYLNSLPEKIKAYEKELDKKAVADSLNNEAKKVLQKIRALYQRCVEARKFHDRNGMALSDSAAEKELEDMCLTYKDIDSTGEIYFTLACMGMNSIAYTIKTRDSSKEFLDKAVALNYPKAFVAVGQLLYFGRAGYPLDKAKAKEYFAKAQKLGERIPDRYLQ